jgi:hypothetical protein
LSFQVKRICTFSAAEAGATAAEFNAEAAAAMNATMGTAACCAPATTGQAAAPPSPAMNSRLRIE